MGAGIGAVGDAVAVDVEIAAEIAAGFQLARRSSPCRGRAARLSSQASGSHSQSFMPMSRSSMTKIGGLQPVGEVERQRRQSRRPRAGSSGSSSTCLVSPCEA